ncbi:LysR family transcriptional regulator [Actinoallomurus iriomotensis]|uniref:LysR family transcriptional regulator n=1 Tax=Actinoallomurus iriomotensis TaxID=478107 RepID=A0A9W6S6C9_9ACTN|nr:LysR family transcriptional regulator [Actinoallomurus iriomotensis]GLY86185.1 LysR family transcriptional regulator [Actinoallomurus iriomotensis]
MFSFDQLRGFVAVAEELHFGRAAERLNMTQPPLSRQVQKLERAIGVRLFERDNRRVELTAAGTAFLSEARRLLALADNAPDLARRISAGSAGTVRIGFTAVSMLAVLPAVLRRIDERLPDVDVDLYEMVTGEQIDALLAHELDLGVARPPFDPDVFGSRVISREAIMVAVPAGHRLTGLGRPVEARDLATEPLIMHAPSKARYFYDLVVSLVPISHRNVVHSVSQVLTMVWLVSAGRGIAFIPEAATRLGIEGVEFLPLAGVDKPVELHLLWLKDAKNPALWQVLGHLDGFQV